MTGKTKGSEVMMLPAKKRWPAAVAAVLAVVLAAAILGGLFLRPGGGSTNYAVAQAEYPETCPSAGEQIARDTAGLRPFFTQSSQTFLTGDRGENQVYSPLNVYLSLSMLAQVTEGESREQILSLLGSESMDALGQQAGRVWEASYRDNESQTSILANSLWLDQDIPFRQDTLDLLARDFYASSYQGEMGSAQFNKAFQRWLDQQTGGLLKQQAGELELDSGTILALVSTVCFKARWRDEFSKSATKPQTFHTPAGDVETNFMYQQEGQTCYWGERFAAIGQPFGGGGTMWFLLPEEGTAPEDLLLDGEAMDFLFAADKDGWAQQKDLLVNKAIPRFDVASHFDLEDGLRELGVADVFDPARSDFTPMTDGLSIALTQADHAVRVAIDEEGCTAAAYTALVASGALPRFGDTADFVLDRPFLFGVTGDGGLPLFVGVVNYPKGK